MKISFVSTVFNEEENISLFIESILFQTKKPDEIIVVDGGSSDQTVANIKNQISKIKKKKRFKDITCKIIIKSGNRSIGRNEAIKQATGDIILCSDAGCVLDKRWIENIVKPFKDKTVNVVAGYYKGKARTVFEKCLIPYVLVMPDKVNPNTFLPASRSMAFKKSVWKKIGGFPEEFAHNEDYVFAQRLKETKVKIFFQKQAVVYWIPRKNLWEAFIMFFRFAIGDAQAGILRSKMLFIFGRYLIGIYLLLLSFIEKSVLLAYGIIICIVVYILWSINKNYRYVQDRKALFYLPLLQFVSDIAVLIGTSIGFIRTVSVTKLGKVISDNKSVSLMLIFYIVLMLSIINWGIPNSNHPFTYFMDEWHQAQAVRTTFTQGSPNVAGSANGSIFHFILSGLYLIPFVLIGFVNPFAIPSPVDSLEIQQRLFQILRTNTLLFGVSSIILIAYIARKHFHLSPFFTSFFFVVNPIWLSLSNYFKYDIALIFWILLTLLFLLRFIYTPTVFHILLASILVGIALSVKLSAVPLIPILLAAVLLFSRTKAPRMKHMISAGMVVVFTFLVFGVPDLLFGRGDISEYLYDNLVRTPSYTANYILGSNYIGYLFFIGSSTVFGYGLISLSLLGLVFLLFKIKKKAEKRQVYLFLFISFVIFILSLIPLKIEARGSRLLVLLPFLSLFSSYFLQSILSFKNPFKSILMIAVGILLLIQGLESAAWFLIKLKADPRVTASAFIMQQMNPGTVIGIESIPIYQSLPDIALKEYYALKEYPLKKTRYSYQTLNGAIPETVIVTNKEVIQFFKKTPKQVLIQKLHEKGYKQVFDIPLELRMLRVFHSEREYYLSGLIQAPLSISFYREASASSLYERSKY